MSEFTKTFLRERIGDEERPGEYFGIFGKHPGWDDHIEDLPLPTASMATAKQLLYVQGIGSQISSGAWTRLAENVWPPDFDHAFLWVRGPQFLAGRMWASRDGKRRAHFPMVALFQGINIPPEVALGPMLGRLEQVAAGCRAARSAEAVKEVIAGVANGSAVALEEPGPEARSTLDVVRGSALKFARDLRGNLPPRCRLPAEPRDISRSLRFWSRICASLAPEDLPLLFLAPLRTPWIDVLAREPAPGQFFCLRAGLPAAPLTYPQEPPETVEELDADELVKAALDGKPPAGRSWFSRMIGH